MNKIQLIKLLEIRGVKELKGMTIAEAIKKTGGDPTESEMVKVNKMAMDFYIAKTMELEKEKIVLNAKIENLDKLVDRLQVDSDKLNYLKQWGVDNWEGYDLAMGAYNDEHN